jgi:WD40 repeat protein
MRRMYRLLVVVAGIAVLQPTAKAAPTFSEWTTPVTLGDTVNSAWDDALPAFSKDGLSLYFTSNRPGGFGTYDIWVSHRASSDAPWEAPINLGGVINASTIEAGPSLSRDGHWLFFHSIRPDGYGGYDLMASWRAHTHDDFSWQTPFNLGPLINSAFNDAGPAYVEGSEGQPSQLYYASDRPGGLGSWDIYVSDVGTDGSIGAPRLVPGLNSAFNDQKPAIRHDGLEMFFFSGRPGSNGPDIWVSTRPSVFDVWGTPMNVAAVNSAFSDVQCALSSDGRTLIVTSSRPGGLGMTDLYVSTRSK